MLFKNSKGTVYYGMHFYPGVAEYADDGEAFRVFLNESTLRAMDPTFAGRPVFVRHVDDVAQSVDELRKEADGWVVESFFNQADGKHWVKFLVVSEKAERAIKNGMRLSNCYKAKALTDGGTWNGVSYEKEITQGEFEHLAIVPDPRYEESVILSPEQFKAYNAEKHLELKRLANTKGDGKMLFFKRAKVENSADLEGLAVRLPKSGREITLTEMVNEADMAQLAKGQPAVCTPDMLVKVGEADMSIGDLLAKYQAAVAELEQAKAAAAAAPAPAAPALENADDEEEEVDLENADDDDDDDDDDALENSDDGDGELPPKTKNDAADLAAAAAKKAADKAAADALRRANSRSVKTETARVDLMVDQVARGKTRYGS